MKQASNSCVGMMHLQAELQVAWRQKDLYREKYRQLRVRAEAQGVPLLALSSNSGACDAEDQAEGTSSSSPSSSSVPHEMNEKNNTWAENQLESNSASSSAESNELGSSSSSTGAAENQLETSSSSEVPGDVVERSSMSSVQLGDNPQQLDTPMADSSVDAAQVSPTQ